MADVRPPHRRGDESDAPEGRDRRGRDCGHGGRGRGGHGGTGEDRAQLILVTGLTLAVLFVAVVLLLNTVIYTENLATRGVDAGGAEAIEFRDNTAEDLAGILHREHRNRSGSDVSDDFNESAATYARTVAGLRARDGVIARVNVTNAEPGHFVAQNETEAGFRNMTTPDGSAANWTVVSGVHRTRDYQLTVDSASLSDDPGDAFTIVADGSGEDWSVTLSNGSAGAIDVRVRNATIDDAVTVSHAGVENVTIDLTAGTVDGRQLPGPVWAGGVQSDDEPYDAYDIRYENGGNATGTYGFVVDERDGTSPLDDSSRPYVVEGIYGVDVDIRHRTPELKYRDVVRIAPGERDA